jgi:hypothetical protein
MAEKSSDNMLRDKRYRSPVGVNPWSFHTQAAAEQMPPGYSRAEENARELYARSA